ncbi:ABC transporter substrate-binding protein [Natrialba sp. INN-245]|uniref:ABC transporter substrate-binding protein n=1 Tax=Natrialba sp. INN-245 TaxID=2690967 RepID=UPI00130FF2E0|nr:ABC transporter substrate-binding protein [Natrialba sp. INN-245]MWV41163.1 ABC transporter substrate-binding protein [Natrialba sp. INN-245]
MTEGTSTGRRELLAGASGIAASALAGCSERFWSHAENTAPEQIELTIKTVPADDDAVAAKIMSHLRENFQAAGIDALHEPIAEAELYRDVLLEGDYDVFVVRHPGFDDTDALYGMLHSQFVSDVGWQNPFHLSDVTVDDLLESQRTMTDGRDEVIVDLLEYLEETAPYTVVAFPHSLGAIRRELPASIIPQRSFEYVQVMSLEPSDGPRETPLEVGVYGEGLTDRLNPLIVDRSRIEGLTELVYDPLFRRLDDEYVPWLATDISWEESARTEATITLRDGVTWHDGTELDADDVVFTHRFLADTSLGEIEGGLPAPRYRGRQAIVETVDRIDARTVRFSFGNTARRAAARSLTIPLFPEHIWEPRSEVVADRQTEALVVEDEDLVGSGLFEFVEVSPGSISLDPYDAHVFRTDSGSRPTILEGFSQFSGIRFTVDPNPGAMIESLQEDTTDITATTIPPSVVETVQESESVRLVSSATDSFYMIGYNIHHPELGNPHFRRILSRLIDREYTVTELMAGYAEPAESFSSLVGIRDDEWDHRSEPVIPRFPGTDGEIDVDRVRSLFEDAGYQYENGVLLE